MWSLGVQKRCTPILSKLYYSRPPSQESVTSRQSYAGDGPGIQGWFRKLQRRLQQDFGFNPLPHLLALFLVIITGLILATISGGPQMPQGHGYGRGPGGIRSTAPFKLSEAYNREQGGDEAGEHPLDEEGDGRGDDSPSRRGGERGGEGGDEPLGAGGLLLRGASEDEEGGTGAPARQ